MTSFDILFTTVVVCLIVYSIYRKRKGLPPLFGKSKKQAVGQLQSQTIQSSQFLDNFSSYAASRIVEKNNVVHGVAVLSVYYDAVQAHRAKVDGDEQSELYNEYVNDFEISLERRLNTAISTLTADGHKVASVKAVACVDRIVFYLTY